MFRLFVVIAALAATAAQAADIRREPRSLAFADFTAAAELTLPPAGEPVLGGVLLLHGATPADMDFTVRGFDGKVKSHILKDIAEHLSAAGFAVLRYNKRHVHGAGRVDYAAFGKLSLADLLDDAGVALDALGSADAVEDKPLFVYGWSEGSLLAGALAARRDNLAGVILQGAVADPAAGVFRWQVANVTADFVEQLAGTERLTGPIARQVFLSDAGMLVKGYVGMAMDPAAGAMRPRINRALDADGDGAISLRDELAPLMARQADSYLPPRADFPVRPLLEQLDALHALPVLILHGENDANVPVDHGRRIATALGANATFVAYPGLGHSLGAADAIPLDDFRPIAPAALRDMSEWLKATTRDAVIPVSLKGDDAHEQG